MVFSLYQHRSLIWQHALADIRYRYAGSGMGVVWNVLHPLAMIVLYSVVFTAIMEAHVAPELGRFGFPLYLCAGFFPWIAFSDSLNRGATAFTANASYLKKLPVPEQVFVAQAIASATLSLFISFAILIVVALCLGLPPRTTWLLLPLPMLLLQIMGLGLGMAIGTINVFFPDVSQILAIVLQVMFWLTPIVYAREALPQLSGIIPFHPLTPALDAIRSLFLDGRAPAQATWWAMSAWAGGSLMLGVLVLRALRSEIRDVL